MSQEMLLYLAGLTVRSLAVAALGALMSCFVRGVAARHAVWVAVVVTSLLLPLADAVLPADLVPGTVQQLPSLVRFEPAALPVVQFEPEAAVPASVRGGKPAWSMVAILYVVVTVALLARLAWAYRKISLLKRASRAVTLPEIRAVAAAHRLTLVPDVRECPRLRVPLTVGFADPCVIVPADWREWDPWKLHAVLSHELAHIRRSDWALRVIASLHRCIFWFNPLSWWMERHLSNLSEKASDEASIAITGDAVRYAEVLLQFAAAAQTGRRFHFEGVAMARKNMRSRIERVLAMRRPGMGIVSRAGWLAVLAMAMPVLYAAAAVHVAPASFIAPPALLIAAIQPAPLMAIEPVVESVATPAPALEEQPAPVQAAPVKVSGQEMQAKLLSQVKPVYPPLAREARIQGVVILAVVIGTDGKVSDVQVVNGHPLLQQAAIDSVAQWVYQPLATSVSTTVTVNFSFQQDSIDGNIVVHASAATMGVVSASAAPSQGPTNIPGRLRVGRLAIVTQAKPTYPDEAKAGRIQGVVILEVVVGSEGTVKELRVINGHPVLQQAAIDAVSKWKFVVPMLVGEYREAVSTVTVNFAFNDVNSAATLAPRGVLGAGASPAAAPGPGSIRVLSASGSAQSVPVISFLKGCVGCSIVFSNNGSRITTVPAGRPTPPLSDFSVRLTTGAGDMEITCLAQECGVSSVMPNGATFVQSITNGNSGLVSAFAVITVGVSR